MSYTVRSIEEGPYPYHAANCKLAYKKPAIYCEGCKTGESQMDFFFVGKEEGDESESQDSEEEKSVNRYPERGIPFPICICKKPYSEVSWPEEDVVVAVCGSCGDRSRQRCSKDFIKKGYKWR